MDDVNVLRQACCAFINLFLTLVQMDTFRQALKISSICNKVFRTMFLKPDTVGIIPRGVSYVWPSVCWSYSMTGIQWTNKGRRNPCRKWEGGASARGTKCKSWWLLSKDTRSLWVFGLLMAWLSMCTKLAEARRQCRRNIAEQVWGNISKDKKIKNAICKIV